MTRPPNEPMKPNRIETFDDAQASVAAFLQDIVGPERPKNIEERAFRFFEEAAELVSACGIEFEDLVVLLAYVYYKATPKHKRKEEAGDATYALAALLNALNVNMAEAVQEAAKKCRDKQSIIADKAGLYIGGPLPGGVLSDRVKNEPGVTLAGNLGAQLKHAFAQVIQYRAEVRSLLDQRERTHKEHEEHIKRVIDMHKLRTGEVEAYETLIKQMQDEAMAQDKRILELEQRCKAAEAPHIEVRSTQQGHVGFITGDPAHFEPKVDAYSDAETRRMDRGDPAPDPMWLMGKLAAADETIEKLTEGVKKSVDKMLRLENQVDIERRARDTLAKELDDLKCSLRNLAMRKG